MIPMSYFAGFEPKDLMAFLYLPAIGILLLASLIIFIVKRKGHPYSLTIIVFPLFPFGWYLYDKLSKRQVDRSQTLLLIGVVAVIAIFAVANTSIIPEQDQAVNAMALLATASSLCFFLVAVRQRND